jgi:hypothetical protein
MCAAPISVRLSTIHSQWPWFRQTPDNDGVWGDLRFRLEGGSADADWLVVFDEPSLSLRTTTPLERRILFVTEPTGVKIYPSRYANQFGIAVSPVAIPGFRGRALTQQSALPWHYGVDQRGPDRHAAALQWKALAADKAKSKLASVICSSKAFLPHHRQRLAFVEQLKTRLGDRVDVYGRGLSPIDDKQEAIASYKYHIALENNVIDHFWTEKLADAYLGDAFPIFSGCNNVDAYFDERSFRRIDIGDKDRAIDDIEAILDSTLWEDNREFIREARRRVMCEYNLFAVVENIVRSADARARAAETIASTALRPVRANRLKKFRRRLYRLLGLASRPA